MFRARILLSTWEAEGERQRYSSDQLLDAFLPAVRAHLRDAYGWFLLAVSGVEESVTDIPPSSVADLPAPDAGRMRAPELAEFSSLESDGWLADLLLDNPGLQLGVQSSGQMHGSRQIAGQAGGLLVSDREPPGLPVARRWAESLSAIMQRMDDSLAEC